MANEPCWYCGSADQCCQKPFADVPCRRPVPSAPEPNERAVRIWWKTGPEGEFMMSPALKGDAERMLADGWRPTYDGPATSPTEVEIRAEYDGFIDPEMLRLAHEIVASRSAAPPVPAAAPAVEPTDEQLNGWIAQAQTKCFGVLKQHRYVLDVYRATLPASPEPAAAPAGEPTLSVAEEGKKLYVCCCQCRDCDHIGINDESSTHSACGYCDWTGPNPDEDKCPDCGNENVMNSACPKCNGRYTCVAEDYATLPASPEPATQGAAEPSELHTLMELNAWRSALVGLCQGASDTHDTPEKAATNVRRRLGSMGRASPAPEPAANGAAKPVHTDHPFQHWDRTCPACVLEASPPVPNPATQGAAIQIRQADERGDDALKRAHKLEEALEYLFLAIVTRADSDYLFRAVNRADEALRYSMPGWTPPVPMTGWASPAPEPLTSAAGEPKP